jgi:hypothetical protein
MNLIGFEMAYQSLVSPSMAHGLKPMSSDQMPVAGLIPKRRVCDLMLDLLGGLLIWNTLV